MEESSDDDSDEDEPVKDLNPNLPPSYDVDKRQIYDETNPYSSNMSGGTNSSPMRAGDRKRSEASMKAKAEK